MTIVRRLARPLLAAPLIQSGVETARHPGPQAELARPLLAQIQQPLRLPADQVQVVRAAGAVTATAGILLALGRLPRLSALALVITAPFVTSSQPFWKEKDAELRSSQRTEFLKNLGLIGGALLAAVDTEGRPSLAYLGRRAGHTAQDSVVKTTRRAQKSAAKTQKKAVKQLSKQTAKASKKASKAAEKTRNSLPV